MQIAEDEINIARSVILHHEFTHIVQSFQNHIIKTRSINAIDCLRNDWIPIDVNQ